MKNNTSLGFSDNSRLLLATLVFRAAAVVLVIFTLPMRPTLPAWMLEWFGLISWPLLLYSLLLLIFHKRAAALLSRYPQLLYADLVISTGIISLGGSWRSSYFGYTITTIILFTIFIGRRGAYISALTLTAAAVIKDPSGGLPAMEVFFVSNWDMRMGAALVYVTTGVILGYFRTLLEDLEKMSKAKVEETGKRAAMEEKTRLALDLHDGTKQMVNAMILKMNPLIKKMRPSHDEIADELRWLWRGMNYLRSEFDQVMEMLRQDGPGPGPSRAISLIVEDEARTAEVMTGFLWNVSSGPREIEVPLRSQLPLRRFLSEAMMNAWKHSGTTNGTITIRSMGDSASIIIADQGKGFTHPATKSMRTTGMQSLHHRAHELKGELVIETAPGEGCKLILTIPASMNTTLS
jgi:signal transduction histidine kinase